MLQRRREQAARIVPRWIAVILAATVGLVARPCSAVIIFEKGKAEPIRGYLVSEDPTRVVVQEIVPGGSTRERVVPRSNIDDMIQAVSARRLSSLRREHPEGYRDYAEELAEKREDPDARVAALRLYLIAAFLDPEKLGRTSVLGMVALARSPDEERRFRALAYMLDPDHDRSVLRGTARSDSAWSDILAPERTQLAAMLKALREGRTEDARGVARRAGMSDVVARIAPILKLDEVAEVRRGEPVPPSLLRSVLTLELLLAGESAVRDDAAPVPRHSGWSGIGDRAMSAPIPLLALPTITEFNPAHCHFRDGKWVP